MSERYFGKVVKIEDMYTVIANRGSSSGVKEGNKFIIVGIGDIIVDPDTGKELERLEIVRGRVIAIHVQEKISTLKSCDYERATGKREITKHSPNAGVLGIFGTQGSVTETIIPGDDKLKELVGISEGDVLIQA